MSDLYGPSHRRLQDEHDTTRLADRLEALAHVEIPPDERAFIESRPMVFLLDRRIIAGGRPCPIRAVRPASSKASSTTTGLVFPSHDGNGMFLAARQHRGQS